MPKSPLSWSLWTSCAILLSLGVLGSSAQVISNVEKAPEMLVRMTTPIQVDYTDGTHISGSGFYFDELVEEKSDIQEPHWTAVKRMFLITARHVVNPDDITRIKRVQFAFRATTASGIEWLTLTIEGKDLNRLLHISPKPCSGVAAIDIQELVDQQLFPRLHKISIDAFSGVLKNQMPGVSRLSISAGDDVLVIGYPNDFFDRTNKYPIVKLGVLSTPLGDKYDGLDGFLMDFRGYYGSSGSLIISRPTNLLVENGQLLINKTGKDFLFLGVFEGAASRSVLNVTEGADLGLGWYWYNVSDAITSPPISQSRIKQTSCTAVDFTSLPRRNRARKKQLHVH